MKEIELDNVIIVLYFYWCKYNWFVLHIWINDQMMQNAPFWTLENLGCIVSFVEPFAKTKRTFKQVEVIGTEEMITHLPECSFLLYPISCFLSGLVSRVFSAHFCWLGNCQVGNGSHSSANPSAWNGRMPIFDRTWLKTTEKFRMPVTFLIFLAEWEFDIKIEG